MLRTAFVSVLSLFVMAGAAHAGTLFVDANLSTGANDGSSWADAFQGPGGVQFALFAAQAGDDIFVADGTYWATNTGSRAASFNLKNGVALYGGFLGGEASPAERPPLGVAPSVLTGDLNGDDALGQFGDNSFHIIRTNGTDATAVLDGFDVVSGNANQSGSNNDRGAGILCTGPVSPRIQNTRFMNHRATFGGAAGYINGGAAPQFVNCSFTGGDGGNFGGAFDIAGGGPVVFERCLFQGNTAARAGALEIFATNSGVVVSSCVFKDNVATGSGGGGGIWVGSGGNTLFNNITVVGNSSVVEASGGMRNQGAGGTVVVNSVFWDNVGAGGAQGPNNQVTTTTNVTHSIVQGGFAGAGNSGADPEFVDLAGGDLRLMNTSPGIDAGDTALVPAFSTLDLAGAPRVVDSPYVADTGSGAAPMVDLGAYEWASGILQVRAGCAPSRASLAPQSSGAHVGQPFALDLATTFTEPGFGICYAGAVGLDAGGCGTAVPGIGEVLLNLAGPQLQIGLTPVAAGQGSFALTVPSGPGAVGTVFHLQAAAVTAAPIAVPIEVTELVTGIVEP